MRRASPHRRLFLSLSDSRCSNVFAALLMLAMLAGQWAGLEHRISHAWLATPMLQQAQDAASIDSGDRDQGAAHSCDLFDAAALAAGMGGAYHYASCLRAARDWTHGLPLHSWHAAVSTPFSSRAPPRD